MTTSGEHWWTRLSHRMAASGLNLFGVADGAGQDAVLPGCRSVLLFGSGGGALWEAMVRDLRREPAGLTDEAHPLDAFVHRQLKAADPAPPASRLWVRAAGDATIFADFRLLAHRAGMGHHSKLGLLLHPTWGPWLGLRAACFTTEAIPPTGPRTDENPCAACPAPCADACHGAVIGAEGIDIRACAAFHVQAGEAGPCAASCDARRACPVGAEHAYPALEQLYHYNRRLGRRALAAEVGAPIGQEGSGPHWDAWG